LVKRGFLLVAVIVTLAFSAFPAVPTDAQLKKVRSVVDSITEPSVKKVRAKEMKASEAAEEFLSYVEEAKSNAAKFLLYGLAFEYFVKGEAYAEADHVYDTLYGSFGIEGALEVALPFRKKEMRSALSGRKPSDSLRVLAAKIDKADASCKNLRKLKAALAKTPDDKALSEQLGVAYAVLGSWNEALEAFSKAGGKLPEIAEYERLYPKTGMSLLTTPDIADFWWDYVPKGKAVKDQTAAFRRHASIWYARALENDSLTGLLRMRAEKRAAEAAAEPDSAVPGGSPSVATSPKTGLLMVVPPCEMQPVEWRYTVSDPGNQDWRRPGVSLLNWKKAFGPFGNAERCRTNWSRQRLWAAYDFTLSDGDQRRIKYMLVRSFLDDGATLFVNGNEIGHWSQWTRYGERRFDGFRWETIFRSGVNRIAVEASDTGGGACFDLGICLSFDDGNASFSTAALPGTRKTVLIASADMNGNGQTLWKYTTSQPASRWEQPSFIDARKWSEAPAPFGHADGWGSFRYRFATDWSTSGLWLRKEVTLEDARSFKTLLLRGFWDDSIVLWINGTKVFSKMDFTRGGEHEVVILPETACRALKTGKNVIAAECHNEQGGQAFDIGLIAISENK